MGLNATLDAAEAHFGQASETLSLCLNLRQRDCGLIRSAAGAWLTDEPKHANRKGFSLQTVQDSFEVGLLASTGEDDDGPTGMALTEDGKRVAGEVLAWIRQRNAPPPPPTPPTVYFEPRIIPTKGPCSAARLAEAGAIDPAELANPDDAPEYCAACEAGEEPRGGNVDLACADCGHRSCEKGA